MIAIESGQDLRAQRIAAGVSLPWLAGKLGVNARSLSDIELGKLPAHPDTFRDAEQILTRVRPRPRRRRKAA